MAGTYKKFLQLLESWPLDKSKGSNDLGQHIRVQIKQAFSKGEAGSSINQEECNRYYQSLQRIAANQHGRAYPRLLSSSASGLTKEQCNLANSPEMREYLEQEHKTVFQSIKATFGSFFSEDKKSKN